MRRNSQCFRTPTATTLGEGKALIGVLRMAQMLKCSLLLLPTGNFPSHKSRWLCGRHGMSLLADQESLGRSVNRF